jgi:hypothetical protein
VLIWSYHVFERDPDRPRIVTGSRQGTVELLEGENFWSWARKTWPGPDYSVELDPGQEGHWSLAGG